MEGILILFYSHSVLWRLFNQSFTKISLLMVLRKAKIILHYYFSWQLNEDKSCKPINYQSKQTIKDLLNLAYLILKNKLKSFHLQSKSSGWQSVKGEN